METESQVPSDLGNLAPFCKSVVKNLGVQFDVSLKFYKQINSVVKSCFFHLRLLAKVKPFLSTSNFEKLIHAFIFVRLDYCNSLYAGVSQSLLTRLKLMHNAASRLLMDVCKKQHTTGSILNYISLYIKSDTIWHPFI